MLKPGSAGTASVSHVARSHTTSVAILEKSHLLSPGFVQYGLLPRSVWCGHTGGNSGPPGKMALPCTSSTWPLSSRSAAGVQAPSSLPGE